MTVNITINADTLEIYQDGELTSIKTKEAEKKDKPESENDWIVRRRLKPQSVSIHDSPIRRLTGVYFYRSGDSKEWHPKIFLNSEIFPALSLNTCEILGPITPDMFL